MSAAFLFLFLLSYFGYAIFVSDIYKWKIENVPLFVALADILLLYLGGLLNILAIVAYGLHGLGVLLLIWTMFRNRHNLSALLRRSLTPGIVFFGVVLALDWLLTRKLQFFNWDEFSHWGLIYKTLVSTDHLPGKVSPLLFPFYPQGTALFQYFLAKILSAREGTAFFASDLLIFSSVLTLSNGFSWKKWFFVVIAGVFSFLYILIYQYYLHILLVDYILGILFGIGISKCVCIESASENAHPSKENFFIVLAVTAVLPLIKMTGLFFAVALVLFYILRHGEVIKSLLGQIRNIRLPGVNKGPRAFPAFYPSIAVLLLIIAPFLVNESWQLRVNYLGVPLTQPRVTVEQVKTAFSDKANSIDRKTFENFFKKIDETVIGYSGISLKQILIIIGIIILFCYYFIYRGAPDSQADFLRTQLFILITLLVYTLGMLFFYVLVMNDVESQITSGLERYISPVFIAWGLVIFAYILIPLKNPVLYPERASQFAGGLACLLVLTLILKIPTLTLVNPYPASTPERKEVTSISKQFGRKIEKDARVYHVWQHIGGYQHYMMRYEMAPRVLEFWGWSLGKPYDADDVWTVQVTPDEWFRQLKEQNFSYVLVSKPDNQLWKTYGSLFEGAEFDDQPQLFKVTEKNLVRVP